MKKPGFRGPLTRGNLGHAFTESGGINAGTAGTGSCFNRWPPSDNPIGPRVGDGPHRLRWATWLTCFIRQELVARKRMGAGRIE